MSDDNASTSALGRRISRWMREQVDAANAEGLVFGLSGGLDSSVVAALSKMAVGPKALGLIMPCHSSPKAAKHARLVARKLSIAIATVDLTPVCDGLVRRLPKGAGIAPANIRPRLRMTALYYYGNLQNKLVVGTANKTEIQVGYFTKWGDGAVDLLPLGDLYKTQVRRLAKELHIPQEIMDKQPTADLWAGQTDEQELGITYDELDAILAAIESGRVGGFDPDKIERVRGLIAMSEHKRAPVPVFRNQ